MADGSNASLAALWERWEGKGEAVESFIVATGASPGISHVHDHQPATTEDRPLVARGGSTYGTSKETAIGQWSDSTFLKPLG